MVAKQSPHGVCAWNSSLGAHACERASLWVIGRCHENMAAYTLKWLSGYSLAVIHTACKTTEQNRECINVGVR